MSKPIRFDAFLSHNSKNKPGVRELKAHLIAARVTVWFDEDELRPGIPWQELLEAGIRASKSIVVVVGADGLGPWEDEEMQGALRLAVSDRIPVIPVLLPGCPQTPKLPLFLGNRTWVDLRNGLTTEGLDKLLWGITGKKRNYGSPVTAGPEIKTEPKAEDEDEPEDSWNNTPPASEPVRLSLNELLPGTWQVQIQLPYAPGVMGRLNVEILPAGMFRGQLAGPMGVTTVEGQWQADPVTNQIGLQGYQTNGYQTAPYIVLVQATGFDQRQIVGMTSAGEQVLWQRTSPAPTPPVIPGQQQPPQPKRPR